MAKASTPIIIYVTRDGLSFCVSEDQPPKPLKFGRDVVSDLEVVSATQLSIDIKKFSDTQKLKPGNAILVLSDTIYFEKSYAKPNAPTNKELEEFSDTVPFSAVSTKLLTVTSGYRQIVINRDYYETILRTLEQLGFKITNVIPAFVLGISGPEITVEHCRTVYHKLDQAVSVGSLLTSPNTFDKKEQVFMEKNKILIIVLATVFIVAAIVTAVITLTPPAKKPRAKSNTLVIPKVSITPTPVPAGPATPSAAIRSALTVRIVNASGFPGRAASLSALLADRGFTKVQTTNSNTKSTSTIITTSPFAATAAGEYVSSLVSSLYENPITATDSSAKTDLVITIGTK